MNDAALQGYLDALRTFGVEKTAGIPPPIPRQAVAHSNLLALAAKGRPVAQVMGGAAQAVGKALPSVSNPSVLAKLRGGI